jgi:hypothetical protein
MRLPFTADQFFDVFRRYNEAIWPNQWLLFLLALLAIIVVAAGGRNGRLVTATLGFLWLWMAFAYHFAFFRKINPAAIGFAFLFAVQGILLIVSGARQPFLVFRLRRDFVGVFGAGLVSYSLIAYPLLGYTLGHRYPAAPTFGLPCPTTIFTLGILMWGQRTGVLRLAAVPLLWAIIGTQAAFALGVWEDLGLPIAAALFATSMWVIRGPAAAHTACSNLLTR